MDMNSPPVPDALNANQELEAWFGERRILVSIDRQDSYGLPAGCFGYWLTLDRPGRQPAAITVYANGRRPSAARIIKAFLEGHASLIATAPTRRAMLQAYGLPDGSETVAHPQWLQIDTTYYRLRFIVGPDDWDAFVALVDRTSDASIAADQIGQESGDLGKGVPHGTVNAE